MIALDPGQVTFLFAPEDDVQDAYMALASTETEEICVGAYALTYQPLIDLLAANASKAGLTQWLLVDKSQTQDPKQLVAVQKLIKAGLNVLVGTTVHNEILHSKFILAKALTSVFTGSFNFSFSAALQDNCSQVFKSADVWTAFRAHFQAEWDQVKANDSQAWLSGSVATVVAPEEEA